MKKVLLSNTIGPHEVRWGEDLFDMFGTRMTRGQGVFTLWGHAHNWPLYVIAENIPADAYVLENPTEEVFKKEIVNGYDYIALEIKALFVPRIVSMMKWIKESSPETKIVIGGYGVMCLYDPPPSDPENLATWVLENADYICYEEGIGFFRKLLGSDLNAPITQRYMPSCGMTLKGLQHLIEFKATSILVALGCPNACEFCITSAFFKGKKVQVTAPEECCTDLQVAADHLENEVSLFNMVFDEDFLLDKEYIMRLGELLRANDCLDKVNFFCFGSIKALSQYTAEELALCGVGAIFIGFESKFVDSMEEDYGIVKRTGRDVREVFEDLHNYGILIVGAVMLGWDFHTRETIMEDIDYFVALKPDMYQVAPLTPCPGTKFYGDLKEQGRLFDDYSWYDMQICKDDPFVYKNFERNEMQSFFDICHERLFKENGASLLSIVDVMLQGFRTMRHSRSPHLQKKADVLYYFASKIGPALFKSFRDLAPSDKARQRAIDLEKLYVQCIGKPSKLALLVGRFIAYPILKGRKKLMETPEFQNISDPPWRITHYPADKSPAVVIARRDAWRYRRDRILRGIIKGLIGFKPKPIHHIRLADIDDFDAEFKSIEIEGNRMNYVDEGEGEVILMLHGNPTWSYLYRHFIKDLKKDYRCIAIDNLGYGLSDKPPNGDYTMQAHIRRLGKIVEKLDLNNITLVCQDWGGVIGLSYAVRNKERFKRLIPMNTAGFLPEKFIEYLKCSLGAWAIPYLWLFKTPWLGMKMGMDWNIFLRLGMKLGVHNGKRQIHKKAMAGYLYPFQRVCDRLAIVKSVRQIPILPRGPLWDLMKTTGDLMKGWEIRTQVIWGMKDPVFVTWFIDKFEELLPNHAPTLKIPTASHFLQDDEPGIIIKRIRDFMSESAIGKKEKAVKGQKAI